MVKKIIIVAMLLVFAASAALASIKLKVAVVNPSGTKEQTTPVKFNLPKGVGPEDIIDIGEMELKYNFEKRTYYVCQTVTLAPAEKKILEVSLRDIWMVHEKEINFLKKHADELKAKLKGSKHAELGGKLSDKIKADLEEIVETQKNPTLSAKQKINLYYGNIAALEDAREDTGMLENLVLDVGGIVEDRVEIPATLAISLAGLEKIEPEDIMELKVKISNLSAKKKKTTDLRYPLPHEIIPECILDSGELEIGYDFGEERFYAFKEDMELEPQETKIFIIKLKDIWKIPGAEIDVLRSHTNNLMLLLKGTEYFIGGEAMAKKVFSGLDEINRTQSLKVPPAKRIAYFRENTVSFEKMEGYVGQLEKLVSRSGSAPGVTIAKAERLKGGGLEPKRQTGYEGVRLIAESIFRGRAPTVATTWKIIFIILGFIGIVAAAFFALWYVQVKKREKKEATSTKTQDTDTKSQAKTQDTSKKTEDGSTK